MIGTNLIVRIKNRLKKMINDQVIREIKNKKCSESLSSELENKVNDLVVARFIENSAVIVSMPKSGTNLIKLVLTNYINQQKKDRKYETITYELMHNHLTLSERQILNGDRINQSSQFYECVGFDCIIHTHNPRLPVDVKKLNCQNFKVIYLSRHPLDSMISSYFYHYKNRPGKENVYSNPSEYLNKYISGFVNKYKEMHMGAEHGIDCIHITYEGLILQPFEEYKKVIEHLNLTYDKDSLALALEKSSINNIKKQEEERGKPIHADFKLKGSFVRSGKVEQFRDYLSETEIQEAYNYLRDKGLEISTWIRK